MDVVSRVPLGAHTNGLTVPTLTHPDTRGHDDSPWPTDCKWRRHRRTISSVGSANETC